MSPSGSRGLRVAVVGHVEWVDFVPVERLPVSGEVVHAVGAFARAAGGGGVAAGLLAEIGASVDFYCALGRDELGERAASELTSRGIEVHVAWRDEPTRRAVTLLESSGERTIVTLGDRLEPRGSDPLPWDRLDGADGVFVTAGDAAAMSHARAARVLVASPRARAALRDGPALDALVYSAGDTDETAWAGELGARAALSVVTEGSRGGHWSGTSSGRWDAAPLPGPVVDAYGCGDSFMAALTYGLASGLPVSEACALGASWGARCLCRAGAPADV